MMILPLNGLQSFPCLSERMKRTASRIFTVSRRRIGARIRRLAHSGSEGGALVEMALVMPVMFVILTGVFTFGSATTQKLQLTEAVNIGGRLLAVDRGDTNPCSTVAAAVDAAAPSLITANIGFSFDLNGVTTSGTTCAGTGGLANPNLVSGKNAELTLTYPCTLSVYGYKVFSTCTLTSQITEIVQ